MEHVLRIRRLLILACTLIKSHVRGEKSDLEFEASHGLITEEEMRRMRKVCTVASGPTGDGKKDKYPTRNRPAFAFQEAQRLNHDLFVADKFKSPHPWNAIDLSITRMAANYERCEHLGSTMLPLPYAQLTRFTTLLFLAIIVPVGTVQRLEWGTIPLCFLTNLVYFLTDECASQMECPFGLDENDVDIEKMIRRIDKHTACQLAQFTSEPVPNFNLYSESRTTSESGEQLVKPSSMDYHSIASLEPVRVLSPRCVSPKQALKKSVNTVRAACRLSGMLDDTRSSETGSSPRPLSLAVSGSPLVTAGPANVDTVLDGESPSRPAAVEVPGGDG